MFVLEEVQKDFRQAVFGSVFIAAAVARYCRPLCFGAASCLSYSRLPGSRLLALPVFAVLGIAAGLLGVVYNRSLIGTLNLFARIPPKFAISAAALVGAIMGLVAWFVPGAVGGGHSLAETFLAGHLALAAIPMWFLARFVLSMASYGTGAPGGIFGAAACPRRVDRSGRGRNRPSSLSASGSRSRPCLPLSVWRLILPRLYAPPLTGIVLIIEMTGNYAQMLPLLVACFCAYVVAEGFGELPIYENLLERDLMRGGPLPDPKEPLVLELEVEPRLSL